MDCAIFRKRLSDLIEENIDFDMKKAMLEHIEKCDSCRVIYKEELAIEESFRAAFSIGAGDFRSLRPEIMKNIDKNRYGKGPLKKLLNHLKKYKANYTALAAVAAALIFITPYITKIALGTGLAKNNSPKASIAKEEAAKKGTEKETKTEFSMLQKTENSLVSKDLTLDRKAVSKEIDSYLPKFRRAKQENNFTVSLNTPWESSVTGMYSATIQGRGYEGQEEGLGTIVLKDKTDQYWSFELVEDEIQYTPKMIKWIDDENLLIIVGYGYGTIDVGGKLYILNIKTNNVVKPNPNNIEVGKNTQITKINSTEKLDKNKLKIYVEFIVYLDDNATVSKRENGTIICSYD